MKRLRGKFLKENDFVRLRGTNTIVLLLDEYGKGEFLHADVIGKSPPSALIRIASDSLYDVMTVEEVRMEAIKQ